MRKRHNNEATIDGINILRRPWRLKIEDNLTLQDSIFTGQWRGQVRLFQAKMSASRLDEKLWCHPSWLGGAFHGAGNLRTTARSEWPVPLNCWKSSHSRHLAPIHSGCKKISKKINFLKLEIVNFLKINEITVVERNDQITKMHTNNRLEKNYCFITSNNTLHRLKRLNSTHQLYWMAQTGNPQPNISTTFIGRSSPLDDLWRHTPRSAQPKNRNGNIRQMVPVLNFMFQVVYRSVSDNLQVPATAYTLLRVAIPWQR